MRDNFICMKRLFPFALAVLLASCSSPSSSSLSPTNSSSSSEASPSSSVTSSEASSSESSESSSSPVQEKKIGLYRATSRLFLNDANAANNPFLKTYRHKDHEDVPYVDLDEFQHVRRLFDPSLRYHNLTRLEDGRYDLAASFGGHCIFDLEKQTVEIEDPDAFYAEFSSAQSGLFPDVCAGYKYLRGSKKTKFLTKGDKTTYRLAEYHTGIVEQDGHLYVPFSFASHLLVNPMLNSFAYNGKDFYSAKLIGPQANVVRAYSNDTGFLWSYSNTADTTSHYLRVSPKEGESYRFEGTIKDAKRADAKCSAVFLNDGTLTFKSEDLMETVDYKGTWAKDGDILVAQMISEGMGGNQTQYIDLSEGGYYRQTQRTASMAQATYYQLCMDFDYQYGLKNMLGITSFDAEFQRLGYKDALMGKDVDAYQDTLSKFLVAGKMGDSHYTGVAEGFYSLHPGENVASKHRDEAGERIIRYQNGVAKVSQARSGQNWKHATLNIEDETAIISFTSFQSDYTKEFKGIDAYQIPVGTEDVDAFLTSKMNSHVIEGICYALNAIKGNDAIKNVCFDVGYNIGGYVMFVPFISAIMTDDPSIIFENSISGSRIEAHYEADLNADGIYGGKGDTWKDKYNYFVIQAGGSFSAGNIFPTAAKNGGYARTIGEPTAGGGCGVTRRCDITGYFFQYNGCYGFPTRKNDGSFVNSEIGTTPMIEMDVNDVYDPIKLNTKLKELNAQQ